MTSKTRRATVLSFATLCVIAREQIPTSRSRSVWAERVKRRLVSLRMPYPERPDQLTAAMDAVERGTPATPPPADVDRTGATNGSPGLTRREALDALNALRARGLSLPLRAVPPTPLRSLRHAEIHKASTIVAQAIVEQVERCEAAERAAEESSE